MLFIIIIKFLSVGGKNMKKKMIGILVCMLLITISFLPIAGTIENSILENNENMVDVIIQPPEEWNNTFGGTDWDGGYSGFQASDGGYIITGLTVSYSVGGTDLYLIKTNADGNEQWSKTFGGGGDEWGETIIKSSDGNYIICGVVESYGAGGKDAWLLKTDTDGNEIWNNTFGGGDRDVSYCVSHTSDGGYILTGRTESYGAGGVDVYLVKTDSNGNMQWQQTFGGASDDVGASVLQTSDGGYIISGWTWSFDINADVWLIKTDENGNEEWNKTYGGTDVDSSESVIQTSDGGYIIAGSTYSYGAGSLDAYLIKTDSNGNMQWEKTFGGADIDVSRSILQINDGGYIIAGNTYSFGAGGNDVWLIRGDINNNENWNITFGGSENDWCESISQTSDGGYIITGTTYSFGAGERDVWLIKVESENKPPNKPKITGETNGKSGVIYTYTFNSTDPNDDDIYYYVEWGDGSVQPWFGPFESGVGGTATHSWSEGTWIIRAQAKDTNDAESEWATLEITMPRKRAIHNPWLYWFFVKFAILERLLGSI